jgi:hypothetical protein
MAFVNVVGNCMALKRTHAIESHTSFIQGIFKTNMRSA